MGRNLTESVKEIYHKLIRREYSKYEQSRTLKNISLLPKDFEELGIQPDMRESLLKKGFLIKLGDGEYRTLLMDVVYRSADVRVKYGGTKYVLESELKLKVRPILRHDYVKFDGEGSELRELKEAITRRLNNSKITEGFLLALRQSGVNGLSKYQYQSIVSILNSSKDAVVSAPTAFGKTYTFVIPMLVECLKAAIEGTKGTTAVIFYPRKSLGSDQMGKLIRLVDNINACCGSNITIGIDEGDTKKRAEIRDGDIFRGIKCPHHGEQNLSYLDKRVYCAKGRHHLDFICPTKDNFKTSPPSIVITNIYSYPYRLSTASNWSNGYLSKDIKFFIFDEIHAYRGIVAGMLKYFIGILRSLVAPEARVVISSATIPHLEDFVAEITSKRLDDMLDLVYKESRYGRDSEKLELYLLVGINPYTSWETYAHELAIYLSSVNRLRESKNLQSLIFIDSVKNINRVYGQAREAIKLGDPKDHFSSALDARHPYSYWPYNEGFKTSPEEIDTRVELVELRRAIDSNLSYHYSQRPDRFEIEEKIKTGGIDVVFTTSTLELGVDYDNVSVVVNAGIPFSLESIVQRVGRAGRKESSTLNTSLSIVVVKNNPLQYFYLYKGIDFLVDPDMMQKIPVSYNNQFVILYSSMLYTISAFAKQGDESKGGVKSLWSIIDYINQNEGKIRGELGVQADFSKIRENTQKIIEILGRDDIEDKCKEVQSYLNTLWLRDSLLEIDQDIGRVIQLIEPNMEKVATREKGHFQTQLATIKQLREQINDEAITLDKLEEALGELHAAVDSTKHLIKSQQHPLIESKRELQELSQSLFEAVDGAGKTTTAKGKLTKEEYGLYSRACEIHKSTSDHIVKLIETLVGVKFMGTQFMDQSIFVKPLHQSGNGEEEFLTSVVERMPPFELANVPFESKEARELTNAVGARHVWFPKPKHRFILTPSAVPGLIPNLENHCLSGGTASKMGGLMVPESIELIDVSALDKPLIVRVGTRQGPPLYIKYGSDFFSGSKVRGQYPLPRNIRSLYQEHKLSNYQLVKEATLAELELMDDRLINQDNNRWGLNFRYVSMCRQGFCITTDPYDVQCPKEVQKECTIGAACGGTRHWNKFRKMFPKFNLRLTVGNVAEEPAPLMMGVNTRTYEDLQDDIDFVYSSAYTYLPYGFNDYMSREIELVPFGYKAKTSYIVLNLNRNLVDAIASSAMASDGPLLDLLKFKYYMYCQSKTSNSTMDASVMSLRYDSKNIDEASSEFKDFIRESLVHSLAHMFYSYLAVEKIGVEPDKMVYFIKDTTVFILENSKNDGIGIVETVRNELKDGETRFLQGFFEWSQRQLRTHQERVARAEATLRDDAKRSLEILKANPATAQPIANSMTELSKLTEKVRKNVLLDYMDITTFRQLYINEVNPSEDVAEYILTLINSQDGIHLCSDGCTECLIFPNGCSEPFSQVYVVSRNLLSKYIAAIQKGSLPIVRKGLGDLIGALMDASQEIVVKSPFVDSYGLEMLLQQARMGKKILLITRYETVSELGKHPEITIKASSSERFHSKLYYFKMGGQELVVQGSLNLIKSSLLENEETITVIWDKDQISSLYESVRL